MIQTKANKPIIGLVGGVGSGKSTVADMLVELGCRKIDADRIGHQLLQDPQIRDQLAEKLGPEILDQTGQVDRKVLASMVFDDGQKLAQLNAVMHPPIGRQIDSLVAKAQADSDVKAIVLDAAVMLEAGWDGICTDLVLIQSPPEARFSRVSANRGWGREHWQDREKSQFAIDRKAHSCSYVVDNSSGISSLQQRVSELLRQILDPADPPA